jgi:hypothetical protein
MGILKKIFNSIGETYETPIENPKPVKRNSPQDSKKRQAFSGGGSTGTRPVSGSAPERAFERPRSSNPTSSSRVTGGAATSTNETDMFPRNTFQTIENPGMNHAPTTPTSLVGSSLPDNHLLNEVVGAFDEAFDALTSSAMTPGQGTAGTIKPDEAAVQDLFVQMAANYAYPLKNFIFELKRGTATKDWIEICRPALRSISRAAQNLDLAQAAQRMIDFDGVLLLAQIGSEQLISGEIRHGILTSYAALIEVLPEAFWIGEEAQKREDIIIKSLLKQVPGLGCVTFQKLYEAGLGSMEMLFLANKEDLAAATTIPLGMCERICARVQQYRKEVEDMPLDGARSGYRFRLNCLVRELRREEEEFEYRAGELGSHPALAAKKRQRRQSRQQYLLQITVMLAELGELELIHKIQRVSFVRRIQKLDEYLTNTAG